MHQVLAHSTTLINANDSIGLGSLSEEPIEHKNLRHYRESLARKTTQNANLSDDYGLNLTQSSGVIVMPLNARHVMENTAFDLAQGDIFHLLVVKPLKNT